MTWPEVSQLAASWDSVEKLLPGLVFRHDVATLLYFSKTLNYIPLFLPDPILNFLISLPIHNPELYLWYPSLTLNSISYIPPQPSTPTLISLPSPKLYPLYPSPTLKFIPEIPPQPSTSFILSLPNPQFYLLYSSLTLYSISFYPSPFTTLNSIPSFSPRTY